MNSKEKNAIIKKLQFPANFTKKGTLSYKLIKEDNLYYVIGFFIDDSIDKDNFFMQYFVQPLFIEFPTYVFTLGQRIGGHWNINDIPDLQGKLDKFFSQIPQNIHDIVNYIKKEFGGIDNLFKYQALAYSYILILDYKSAFKELNKVSYKEIEKLPLWKREELERIEVILNLLEKEKYGEIKKMLALWQRKTLENIRINIDHIKFTN